MNNLFPLAVATGNAFCNRETERLWLKNNFQLGKHSLIISPRRYGKTSLILKTIEEKKLHHIQVDLFSCLNSTAVEQKILTSIGLGITKIVPKIHETFQTLKSILTNLRLSLDLYHGVVTLKIERTGETKENLSHALQGLEKIAHKFSPEKKVVVFIDELQELANLSDAKIIEALIREHAQTSRALCFVFSGSNRHLLTNIFENSDRPLYMLCDKLVLQRITPISYRHHLNQAAVKKWGKTLPSESLDQILSLTACHPYYINVLCGKLWVENKLLDNTQVTTVWNNYVTEEISRVAQTLDRLSDNQKKLLITLSKLEAVNQPTSQEFLNLANMPGASVRMALKSLLQQDLVYLDNEHNYRVLDPLFQSALSR